jgi:hypothetical protein
MDIFDTKNEVSCWEEGQCGSNIKKSPELNDILRFPYSFYFLTRRAAIFGSGTFLIY